ncbi:TonB-dependent receptor plug domain-containing protein [Hydrocarboniclastica marina]|uniref:TonB-dependent receptor n=1 Tax=Hydrocarboniclastica marina TaxID=2259620 RepID=A0A4P7XLU5_9ALTE|nr:TonB-dependent receptor [Hydrocarboniclastica marina]QCF27564.1 TonB-dependent receptor [Hydrocarboniclastica marina]
MLRRALSRGATSCSVWLALTASNPALGADTASLALAPSVRQLDQIVVTGTRSPRKVSDTPVRTEVVPAEEIHNTHARDVKEALENVPGVLLREIHGKAGYEVWMQGLNADRVRVLIDGQPMTATTGSAMDVTQLSTVDIERIEVVKGAVSAQYGSAAMGGVVNIITRPVSPGIAGEVTVDGGSYGDQNPDGEAVDFARRNLQTNLSMGGEKLRWRISAARQENDGVDPEPATWARPGDAVERSQLATRLDWMPDPQHRLSAEFGYFLEEGMSRYLLERPGNNQNAGKEETAERWRGVLNGEHRPGASSGNSSEDSPEWHWSLLHEDLENTTEKYTASSRFDRRDATHTLSRASGWTQIEPLEDHQLQLGTDFNHASLEQHKDGASELAEAGEFTQNTRELWLQDTWFASESWEWSGGLRYQHDSDFGGHVAPKLNARYDLYQSADLNLYLRGGWGAGYRVPNLKERHYRFDHSQLGYVVEGSTALEPEESDSYQLGWGLSYRNTAWFEINAFRNDIDQLVQTELDPAATAARNDGVQVYRYANTDRARTQGFESTAGWQWRDGWKLSLGYTYMDAEDLDTGQPLTRRPRHQAKFAVDGLAPVPGMSWLVRVRSQSDETVDADSGAESPAFTTVDFKLNQDLGRSLRLFTGIDNLTDTQRNFDDPDDFSPVYGRYIYAGLTLGFGPDR